jgi:ring-1,2-phenylacetyl-CoA epoxidase subunit PaaE
MVLAVKEAMQEAQVDIKKIHFELFTTAKTKSNLDRRVNLSTEEHDKKSKVILKLDGSLRQIEMSYYGDTVLEAALASGADLPYSCRGGMCSTCRAKLVKGQVEMDVNYSLEPDEVAAGYILTCQARPLTEELEVDFDQ